MQRSILSLLCVMACTTAMAGQQFSCGPARVVVATELNNDRTKDFDYAGVLTVETQGHQTVLQYRGNVDFLGAACVFDAHGVPKVLFQAICSGSGCHDLDNWGLVDASSLRVELIPSDDNRKEVQDRLGGKAPCSDLVSLGTSKLMRNNCGL